MRQLTVLFAPGGPGSVLFAAQILVFETTHLTPLSFFLEEAANIWRLQNNHYSFHHLLPHWTISSGNPRLQTVAKTRRLKPKSASKHVVLNIGQK